MVAAHDAASSALSREHFPPRAYWRRRWYAPRAVVHVSGGICTALAASSRGPPGSCCPTRLTSPWRASASASAQAPPVRARGDGAHLRRRLPSRRAAARAFRSRRARAPGRDGDALHLAPQRRAVDGGPVAVAPRDPVGVDGQHVEVVAVEGDAVAGADPVDLGRVVVLRGRRGLAGVGQHRDGRGRLVGRTRREQERGLAGVAPTGHRAHPHVEEHGPVGLDDPRVRGAVARVVDRRDATARSGRRSHRDVHWHPRGRPRAGLSAAARGNCTVTRGGSTPARNGSGRRHDRDLARNPSCGGAG